jgi:hypothetical protein
MGTRALAMWVSGALLFFGAAADAKAKDVDIEPMYGGVMIDGYDFAADQHPGGSVRYDAQLNEFRGHYVGLKMPAGRRALFAWLHDTVHQKTTYLGVVGWLKLGTAGGDEGDFIIRAPERFKGGKFGANEVIGFTAEKTALIAEDGTVEMPPLSPAGSEMQASQKPAFYLFAKLPGAATDRAYCGHGKDFFYAAAPDRQTCYDCICGQKYSVCKAVGLAAH